MKIGERVRRKPETIYDYDKSGKQVCRTREGTACYIHPRGRFHTVEFRTRGGVIRECFAGV